MPWKLHVLIFIFCSSHYHPCCMVNSKYNSLRSFSSDRSYTLNRSSYARDSMMIEELLVPPKDQVCGIYLAFLYRLTFFSKKHSGTSVKTSCYCCRGMSLSLALDLNQRLPSCSSYKREPGHFGWGVKGKWICYWLHHTHMNMCC